MKTAYGERDDAFGQMNSGFPPCWIYGMPGCLSLYLIRLSGLQEGFLQGSYPSLLCE